MNNRANIMYFIEHLCEMAQRENHRDFVRMMQQDILRVVDAVAPSDGSGAANVKVVRRVTPSKARLVTCTCLSFIQVLGGLQQKSILSSDTVIEIEACLKERDTLPAHAVLSPIEANRQREQQPSQSTAPKTNGVARPDKRQIEQRIEEDRERHKRLRENIWAVSDEADQEFERLWDEASEVGDDDFIAAEEDALERTQAIEVE